MGICCGVYICNSVLYCIQKWLFELIFPIINVKVIRMNPCGNPFEVWTIPFFIYNGTCNVTKFNNPQQLAMAFRTIVPHMKSVGMFLLPFFFSNYLFFLFTHPPFTIIMLVTQLFKLFAKLFAKQKTTVLMQLLQTVGN